MAEMSQNKVTLHQAKDTGMALVLACLLVMFVSERYFLLPVTIALLAVTMTWPKAFRPAARVWFGLSHFIGNIVSRVLLTVLFFTVVTPMAIIRRMAGADSLKLKRWGDETDSVFAERNHSFSAADLERPY